MALEGQDTQHAGLGLSTSQSITLSFYVKSSLTRMHILKQPDASK